MHAYMPVKLMQFIGSIAFTCHTHVSMIKSYSTYHENIYSFTNDLSAYLKISRYSTIFLGIHADFSANIFSNHTEVQPHRISCVMQLKSDSGCWDELVDHDLTIFVFLSGQGSRDKYFVLARMIPTFDSRPLRKYAIV